MAQFTDAKIHDPELQKFMQRIRIEEDGGFSSAYPECSTTAVEVVDSSGQTYKAQVSHTQGFPQSPFDARGIEEKFTEMTSAMLDEKQRRKTIDWLWDLDNQKDIGELFRRLVIS